MRFVSKRDGGIIAEGAHTPDEIVKALIDDYKVGGNEPPGQPKGWAYHAEVVYWNAAIVGMKLFDIRKERR